MKKLEKNYRRRKQAGFTLMEIMIVLAIVGMLFSFVGVNLIKQFASSKQSGAKIQMANFDQALTAYYMAHGNYPHTSQGLEALVRVPTVGRIPANYPDGGYLKQRSLPKDPWNQPYQYVCEDYQNYQMSSGGPDGQPGTGDDIVFNADDSEKK